MLEVTRERIYGGFAGPSKHVYRARIGNNDLATGNTRTEATERAYKAIDDTLAVTMACVRVGICADGTIITAREYRRREVELQYHRGSTLTDPLYKSSGSSMGLMAINGESCDLDQYLRYHVLMYNGIEYSMAADIVFGRIARVDPEVK